MLEWEGQQRPWVVIIIQGIQQSLHPPWSLKGPFSTWQVGHPTSHVLIRARMPLMTSHVHEKALLMQRTSSVLLLALHLDLHLGVLLRLLQGGGALELGLLLLLAACEHALPAGLQQQGVVQEGTIYSVRARPVATLALDSLNEPTVFIYRCAQMKTGCGTHCSI